MSGTNETAEIRTGVGEKQDEELESQTGADCSGDEVLKEKEEKIARLEKELKKTRQEAANSRINAKSKDSLEETVKLLQSQLNNLKTQKQNETLLRKLDKAGCVKSELVLKDVPEDCEDVDLFIEEYKKENAFLFGNPRQNHGGNFRGTGGQKLSSSQQINQIIRSFAGYGS